MRSKGHSIPTSLSSIRLSTFVPESFPVFTTTVSTPLHTFTLRRKDGNHSLFWPHRQMFKSSNQSTLRDKIYGRINGTFKRVRINSLCRSFHILIISQNKYTDVDQVTLTCPSVVFSECSTLVIHPRNPCHLPFWLIPSKVDFIIDDGQVDVPPISPELEVADVCYGPLITFTHLPKLNY